MERRVADIEYEQMMLSRYTIAQQRQSGGLDRSVYLLMSRIDSHGPMTIAELSPALRLDASTLQRQVTGAIKDGYLERIANAKGQLARKVSLTRAGYEQLIEARELSVKSLDNIMAGWAAEDIDQFANLLARFNASIEEYSKSKRG